MHLMQLRCGPCPGGGGLRCLLASNRYHDSAALSPVIPRHYGFGRNSRPLVTNLRWHRRMMPGPASPACRERDRQQADARYHRSLTSLIQQLFLLSIIFQLLRCMKIFLAEEYSWPRNPPFITPCIGNAPKRSLAKGANGWSIGPAEQGFFAGPFPVCRSLRQYFRSVDNGFRRTIVRNFLSASRFIVSHALCRQYDASLRW
jgi:hypothetical protein